MNTETITWHDPVPDSMPDAMTLVLLEREAADIAEPVDTGYWDGEYWCNSEGLWVPGRVTGWAHLPIGRKGGGAL
jgi:hypothetical protein